MHAKVITSGDGRVVVDGGVVFVGYKSSKFTHFLRPMLLVDDTTEHCTLQHAEILLLLQRCFILHAG